MTMMRAVLICVLASAACGGSSTDTVSCHDTATDTFPTFDRHCTTDADCALVARQVDCCGTNVETAVNVSAKSSYEAAAAECAAMYPGCGCAPAPTTDDQGLSSVAGMFLATCDSPAMMCRSHALNPPAPPDAGL
jgi:hypothetical protein